MGIQVGDNFDHKSKKPLDNRTAYATLAAMKAVVDATINEGCLAYCSETDKYYKFLSTNTVDEDTGKWREFSSGGGGTSDYSGLTNKPKINNVELSGNKTTNDLGITNGHVIKNSSGTSVAQRGNLQFDAPFTVTDDSTNGKTKIGQNTLSSGDLDDFDEPSQMSPGISNFANLSDVQLSSPTSGQVPVYNGTKWVNGARDYHEYSTSEKAVGKWIDGKTIYEKTVNCGALPNATSKTFAHGISNIDKVVGCEGMAINTTNNSYMPLSYASSTAQQAVGFFMDRTSIYFGTGYDWSSFSITYVTVRYTKV